MHETTTAEVRAGSVIAASLGVGVVSGSCGGLAALVIWVVVASFDGGDGAGLVLVLGSVVALIVGAVLGSLAAVVLGLYLWVIDAVRHGARVFSVAAGAITALVMAALTTDQSSLARIVVVVLSSLASARMTWRFAEGTTLAR